jgi:hypothetical protein
MVDVIRLSPRPRGHAAYVVVELLLAMRREHGEKYSLQAAQEMINAAASVVARERGPDYVVGYFDFLRGILPQQRQPN